MMTEREPVAIGSETGTQWLDPNRGRTPTAAPRRRRPMRITRRSAVIATAIALFAGLGIGQAWLQNVAQAQARTVEAPKFEVDPLWPKPLPNHWVLGMTIGIWVDEQDMSGSSTAAATRCMRTNARSS
jgi:hypothetical protein